VVGHRLGPEVDLGEPLRDEEQDVRLVELGDLLGQLDRSMKISCTFSLNPLM